MKFTFKIDRPSGRWSWLQDIACDIKLKGEKCGYIEVKDTFTIRFMVKKKDLLEDNNSNCEWKWIILNEKFSSLEEAKDFLNKNIQSILEKYNLYFNNF